MIEPMRRMASAKVTPIAMPPVPMTASAPIPIGFHRFRSSVTGRFSEMSSWTAATLPSTSPAERCGYILTEDVTKPGGRPARSTETAIFLGDVSRIQPAT